MTAPHSDVRRSALKAATARDQGDIQTARIRERIDLPLTTLILIILLALAGTGYFAARAMERSGWFDPPMVRPLPDERILTNLRDSTAPFVGGAALANGEGPVVMLREDGRMTRFNEATGLLSTREITPEQTRFQSEVVGLSAGCGNLQPPATPCPEPDRLYLLSSDGGLVESDDKGASWRVRLRDAPWIGRDGTPVEQEDVQVWAASGDGRHVAVFAGDQGVAVFDQQRDLWWRVADTGRLRVAAESGPVHLLAAGGRFWFGTAQGFARLDVNAATAELTWSDDPATRVRDLDLTAQGELIALTEAPCATGGGADCLAIMRVEGLNDHARLVGEQERIASLSGTTLRHAVMQGARLVVVDQAGLFSYDSKARTWQTLASGTVDAFWVAAQDGAVTATLADRLVQVKNGEVALERDVQGGPFTQIEVASDGFILGLARDGQLRDLRSDSVLAGRDGAVPDGVVFHAGASVGERVLLLSRRGLLIHDAAARRFKWSPAAELPTNLRQMLRPQVTLRAAGTDMWLIDTTAGMVSSVTFQDDFPNIQVAVSNPLSVGGPLRSHHAERDGLYVVNQEGRPLHLTRGNAQPQVTSQVGTERRGQGAFTTATAFYRGVIYATEDDLWTYDHMDRSWAGPAPSPNDEQVRDITFGDALVTLTEDGRVYRWSGTGWEPMLGAGEAAAIPLDEVSDALAAPGGFFVAGRGQVQFYDTVASRFDQAVTGGRGTVRLVSQVAGRPVWLSSRQLRFGEDLMTDSPVLGAWDSGDGIVALAQSGVGKFALHFRTPYSAPACTFLGADPPDGEIIDAALLPDGRILTLTSRGAGLYVGEERRWLRVSGIRPKADTRIHIVGGHLLMIDGRSIRSKPVSRIPAPDSCAAPTITLNWSLERTGISATFDAQRGEVALLSQNGLVERWRNGRLVPVLPELGWSRPNPDDFRQALRLPSGPVFAAPDLLWWYNLNRRQWQQVAFELPEGAGPVAEIDLSFLSATRAGVTVWSDAGESYLGTWRVGDGTVLLTRFEPKPLAPIRTPPEAIRDVSARDGNWIVSSEEALEITRIGVQNPVARITLPEGSAIESTPINFGSIDAVRKGDLRTPERLFIFPGENALGRRSGALVALTYDYAPGDDRAWGIERGGDTLWRIASDGRLLSCAMRAGASMETCQLAQAAPLELAEADVGRVFPGVEDVTWAVIGGQLIQFDPTLRQRVAIEGPNPSVASQALSWGSHLLFWDRPGGTLWLLQDETAQAMAHEVTRMSQVSGRLLVMTRDGLLRFDSTHPLFADRLATSLPLTAQSFDWVRGRQVIGLDPTGFVRGENGQRLFDLPLPQASRIATVLRNPQGHIWVQYTDGSVHAYQVTECEIPPHNKVTLPCIVAMTHLHTPDPGLGKMLSVGDARVHFENGSLSHSDAGHEPFNGSPPNYRPLPTLPSTRRDLVGRIEIAPTGRSELAPAKIDRAGAVVLNGTEERLAGIAADPSPYGEMTLGWLSWNRATDSFRIARASGSRQEVSAPRFIRDGRLLMDHPGVARIADADGAIDWITPYAIWRFSDTLAQPTLVGLIDLPGPVGLEAGRVLFPDAQGLALNATALSRDTDASSFSFGALRIDTRWRAQSVTSTVTRADGSTRNGFAQVGGFAHDRRDATGWSDGDIALSTPAGIVPASGFDAVLPLPEGTQPDHLRRRGAEQYAQRANTWWRLESATGTWAQSPDPTRRRDLVETGRVTWTLDGRQLDIRAIDPAQGWRVERDGLAFRADQLIALAASPDAVVFGTSLGTHSRSGAAQIAELGAPHQANPPGGSFDALAVQPGDSVIFARRSPEPPLVWDVGQKSWVAASAGRQPWRDRRAVSTRDIQIDMSAGRSAVARHRVAHSDGTQRFARLEWRARERLPQDRARAVHAEGSNLYVGTDMGLRKLFVTNGPTLFDLQSMPPTGDSGVRPVTRLGRPSATPERVLARDDGGACVEISATDQLSPCSDPGSLDSLRVAHTPLWVWDKSDGAIHGSYLRQGQPPLPIFNDPSLRWPHDTLGAHAVCGGALVEIWADTQILREGAITQSLDVPGWTRLHCQGDDAPQGQGQSVSPGLYLTNRSGLDALQRSAPSVWSPVSGPLLAGVQAQANGRWAYQARRIRIKSAGEVSAIYEYRWSDDHWSVLPWVDGLPMIDATRGVLADGTTVDRLTPLGVVRHRRARSRLSIDPDTISIRTTDPPDGFAECAIDRLTRLDGRMHTLTREQGKPIMMRCRDGRILKESVSAQGDLGVFQPDYGDVFAMRNAVAEPDGWVFDIVDETPGSDPDFRISFRDSEVSLSAGRFDLDEYRTVAAPFANRLSLVAGHGLWEHPVERLGLHEGIRPADIPDAETVTSATSDKAQTSSAPLLCLQRGGAGISVTYTQSGEPSQVEACADWRGADALFYYRQIADSGATGLAFAVNGPIISRKIAQGRFTDRVATGPPQPVGRDGDLLFPNPLGAARLDGWGQITELYSYDDTLGVATLTGAGPVVLTSDGLHTLDPDSRTHGCGGLSDALQRQMPEGVTVSSVSVRPGQAVHLRGSDANGPIMVSSSCDASGFRLFADPLGVDRRIRHISWMRSLPGATASLVILQQDNGEIAISDGAGRVLSLVADVSGELLGTFAGTQPRGVVILTDQDAYLLDVDAAVMALARTRPVSPTPEIVPSSPSPTPAPPVPAPPPPEPDTPTAPAAPSPSPTPTPPVPAPSPPEPDTPAAPIPEPQPKPEPESEIRIALLPLLADGSAIDMGRASRDQIRAVQNALRQRGFDPGPIDGIVGPRTQAAIRALQNSRSEPETGLITSQQFRDLMSSP